MQYILNETEYKAYLQMQETANLKTIANMALEAEVENLKKRREADREEILANRERRKELHERLEATQNLLKNSREHIALCNKKLAEQAQLLLAQEAELASFSSKMKEVMRDCEGTAKTLAEARTEAKHLQELADERLVSMHNLSNEVRRLRAEHVCIAKNPKTGTVKVISVVKADTYLKFGWTVSEPYLVDRPA